MGLADVTRTNIQDVKYAGDCKWMRCNRKMVLITFVNGRTLKVHDDGSFLPWLGESDS